MNIILDSAAFINAESFPFTKKNAYFLTSSCEAEIKETFARLRLEAAMHDFDLTIRDPCPASIQAAQRWQREIGDKRLSRADESIVALAHEFHDRKESVKVFTDDYAIQNILKWKKIPFSGILQKGIVRKKKYSR